MTYLTTPKIEAKICDINLIQGNKICKLLHAKNAEYEFFFDRIAQDGTQYYIIEADVTGFSSELYVFLDNLTR